MCISVLFKSAEKGYSPTEHSCMLPIGYTEKEAVWEEFKKGTYSHTLC